MEATRSLRAGWTTFAPCKRTAATASRAQRAATATPRTPSRQRGPACSKPRRPRTTATTIVSRAITRVLRRHRPRRRLFLRRRRLRRHRLRRRMRTRRAQQRTRFRPPTCPGRPTRPSSRRAGCLGVCTRSPTATTISTRATTCARRDAALPIRTIRAHRIAAREARAVK